MPHITADRVRETTATTSTGPYTLEGAAEGYRAFSAVCAVGDTAYYTVTAGANWEVGEGTYQAGNTLARTRIIASSNANAAVNWGAGVKAIFLSATAEQLADAIASGDLAAAKAAEALASATAANLSAGAAAGSAAQALAIYGSTAAQQAAVATAQAQASLAAGHAASAASVVQQDLSGITAQALHRSPNAITALFVYDTQRDSDGGAWTERCQHTSWWNETIYGKWLGAQASEAEARLNGATVGPELIVNGAINGTTGWSTTAGTVSEVGGNLRITGEIDAYPSAWQAFSTVIGKAYRVSFRQRTKTANGWAVNKTDTTSMVGANRVQFQNVGSNLAVVGVFVATATTSYIHFGMDGAVNFSGLYAEYDDISVREIIELPASGDYFQLSTDGKFYRLWKNLLSHTEAFDQSYWSKVNVTVTPNAAAAPSGLVTADKIIATTASGQHTVESPSLMTVGQVYTATVEAKADGIRYLTINQQGSTTYGACFDLQTGTLAVAAGPSVLSTSITALPNGWYRITVTATAGYGRLSLAANNSVNNGFALYAGDGVGGVLLGAIQLEFGPAATAYEAKGAEGPTTEVFRGNKRDFPRLAAIVAEASNVTIYDLTEPGRPMWMRFAVVGGNGASILGIVSAAQSLVATTALNGWLLAGGTQGGCLIDFPRDLLRAVAGNQQVPQKATVADRNATVSSAGDGSTAIAISNSINAIAMAVLPDAPADPVTGLRVPTLAFARSAGLSVVQHSGVVRNSSSTLAFTTVVLTPSLLSFGRADGAWYYAANPGSLAASFGVSSLSSPDAPGFGLGETGKLESMGRARLLRRVANSVFGPPPARVQMARAHETTPSRSLAASIADSFNTGWVAGDIRRCFLSDAVVDSVGPSVELLSNGNFDTDLTGWTINQASSWVNGALRIESNGLPDPQAHTEPFTVRPGAVYEITATVFGSHTSNATGYVRFSTTTSAGSAIGPFSGSGNFIINSGATMTVRNQTLIPAGVTSVRFMVSLGTAAGFAGAKYDLLSISAREVVADRIYRYFPVHAQQQGRGPAAASITGTLTRTQVASGASLVGYSGWSAANYLREPYSADLDFGTGEWTASAWVNVPAVLTNGMFSVSGVELVTNGALDSDSGWGEAGGAWVFQNGRAEIAAANGYDSFGRAISISAGKSYLVECDYAVTSGQISIGFGSPGLTLEAVGNLGIGSGRFSAIAIYTGAAVAGVQVRNQNGATAWLDNISVREVSPATIFDRSHSSGPRVRLGVNSNGRLIAEASDGTTTRIVTTTAAYNTAQWLKARVNYTTDGSLSIWVNGREVAVTRGTPLLTLNNPDAVLTIGNSYALDAPFPGSIALLKLGATVPTAEQAAFMYEQEKQLFRPDAACVLPDAGAIVDMAYDDATDRWVAVSATNESYWTGLVRNSVTPVPAGSFTRIAAGSGIELAARSTTNPGVDVTIPAYGLREELVKRAEAAARLTKELVIYDYVGGITATTTNGSTAITSVANLTYPTSYIGARVSGSGIPANTTIVAVSGTTIYLSAAATASASGVSISFLDFRLPVGMEAKAVLVAGALKQEGSTKDFTRLYDGFVETIRFAVAPGSTAWVQIQASRGTMQ